MVALAGARPGRPVGFGRGRRAGVVGVRKTLEPRGVGYPTFGGVHPVSPGARLRRCGTARFPPVFFLLSLVYDANSPRMYVTRHTYPLNDMDADDRVMIKGTAEHYVADVTDRAVDADAKDGSGSSDAAFVADAVGEDVEICGGRGGEAPRRAPAGNRIRTPSFTERKQTTRVQDEASGVHSRRAERHE